MIQSADNQHIYLHIGSADFAPGWYWADEAEQLNGPLPSEAEATAQFDAHVLSLKAVLAAERQQR